MAASVSPASGRDVVLGRDVARRRRRTFVGAPSAAAPSARALGSALGALLGVVGADVVALLVVGVLAELVLVLGGDDATLGGLLDRQRDAPAVEIDVDDLDPQLLTRA